MAVASAVTFVRGAAAPAGALDPLAEGEADVALSRYDWLRARPHPMPESASRADSTLAAWRRAGMLATGCYREASDMHGRSFIVGRLRAMLGPTRRGRLQISIFRR
jgi:hypothetical protein